MFELATAPFFAIHQPNCEDSRAALFLFPRGSTYPGGMQTRAGTQTAREMAPMMIERSTMMVRLYLSESGISLA